MSAPRPFLHDVGFRLLRTLPPEAAHRAATVALRAGLGPRIDPVGAGATLFGRRVANRLGLSGGADKAGAALAGWRDMGFGFVEAGTVTPLARAGNAGPRVWRMRDGVSMVNWMGLPNPGVEAFAANVEAFRASPGGADYCVGASLSDPSGEQGTLAAMARRLDGLVDFLTVNLRCPNVADHDATRHSARDASLARVEALAGAAAVPVLAKLAPTDDHEGLARWVLSLREAGSSGVVVCNTVPYASRGLVVGAPWDWPTRDGAHVGGLSGPPLLPVALAMARTARSALGATSLVVGVGGIGTGDDARAMLEAGADAVQAYTSVAVGGPAAVRELARALS